MFKLFCFRVQFLLMFIINNKHNVGNIFLFGIRTNHLIMNYWRSEKFTNYPNDLRNHVIAYFPYFFSHILLTPGARSFSPRPWSVAGVSRPRVLDGASLLMHDSSPCRDSRGQHPRVLDGASSWCMIHPHAITAGVSILESSAVPPSWWRIPVFWPQSRKRPCQSSIWING